MSISEHKESKTNKYYQLLERSLWLIGDYLWSFQIMISKIYILSHNQSVFAHSYIKRNNLYTALTDRTIFKSISIIPLLVGIIPVMPLTLNNKTLPVLALPPPIPTSDIMFHNLLLYHSLHLRVELVLDYHKTFFGDDDLNDGHDENLVHVVVNTAGENNFVWKDSLPAGFVYLCVEISVYAWLKV